MSLPAWLLRRREEILARSRKKEEEKESASEVASTARLDPIKFLDEYALYKDKYTEASRRCGTKVSAIQIPSDPALITYRDWVREEYLPGEDAQPKLGARRQSSSAGRTEYLYTRSGLIALAEKIVGMSQMFRLIDGPDGVLVVFDHESGERILKEISEL